MKSRASLKSPDTGHQGGRKAALSARYGVITVTSPALSNGTGRSTTCAWMRASGNSNKAPRVARRRVKFICEISVGSELLESGSFEPKEVPPRYAEALDFARKSP